MLAWIPAAAAAPRTFSIDGNASTAAAHVGKTGLGSFAGHEHLVLAQNVQGEVVLDPDDLSRSSVDLIVDARSLKVSPEGEPEGDPPKVQQIMRGPDVLDSGRFGTIHFGSTTVSGKQIAPGVFDLTVAGELSLHGVVNRRSCRSLMCQSDRASRQAYWLASRVVAGQRPFWTNWFR